MLQLYKIFSSVRLTVVLMALSIVLVFFGTLDQVYWGIHKVQEVYFESVLVIWPFNPDLEGQFRVGIPMLGGYSIGALLLINLALGFFRYNKPKLNKIGIGLIHLGLALLLISGFLISAMQVESQMWIDENGKSNFSRSTLENELVLIDKSNPDKDIVTSVPTSMLGDGKTVELADIGITLKILDFMPNAKLGRDTNPSGPPIASQGAAAKMRLLATEMPKAYDLDSVNTATAIVEVISNQEGNLGSWLVSNLIDDRFPPQKLQANGKDFEIHLRFKRTYYPFWIELIDFKHDRYPGTNIPKNFSSKINIDNPETGEKRQTLIYMNNPLRYAGLTFFQQSFANNDTTSILQIVRNPSWLLPYIAVGLVGLGMLIHFCLSLIKFSSQTQKKTARIKAKRESEQKLQAT